MIEKITAYKTSTGEVVDSIEEAQAAEIAAILNGIRDGNWVGMEVADAIVLNKSKVLDILTMSVKARPKARAINGAKKPRKSRNVVALDAGNQSTAIQ